MEVSNPYEAPRSADAVDETDGPAAANPLLAELLRFRPWLSLAGAAILVAGCVLTALMVIGGVKGSALLPGVFLLIGCGMLSARLFILSRTIGRAAAPPHRIDLCFRDIRKVFSHTGVIVIVFVGLVLLLFFAVMVSFGGSR
jgi:hypothetical protein